MRIERLADLHVGVTGIIVVPIIPWKTSDSLVFECKYRFIRDQHIKLQVGFIWGIPNDSSDFKIAIGYGFLRV